MEALLKGFYGYKNFGDEILFFGLVNRINEKYNITKLLVESGNEEWMHERIKENKEYLGSVLDKIEIVPINQHKIRWLSHFLNIIGLGKYRKHFKFFGGGEVLDDSRDFPHDGRNIALLYSHSIRNKKFVILGGMSAVRKKQTKVLYNLVLSRAKTVVCREKISYYIAKNYNENVILYNDFSLDVINMFLNKQKNTNRKDGLFPYILINISQKNFNDESFAKIEDFCEKYPNHKKIFFPCDINYDLDYYYMLKQKILDLELYNWTKHDLNETISLFYHSDGGIGARLHFLYPLKVFNKVYESLSFEEKIEKMIFND